MVPEILNNLIELIWTGWYRSHTWLKWPIFWLASGLRLELTSLKVSSWFNNEKWKSLRPKNWNSSERENDFLAWNRTWSKMTLIVVIYTYKTITEHNLDGICGHVSKYGKLFCIFPIINYKVNRLIKMPVIKDRITPTNHTKLQLNFKSFT